MDTEHDTGRTISQIRALQECPGWAEWLAPLMTARLDAIRTALLDENLDMPATTRLRTEYAVIHSWLTQPTRARQTILARNARPDQI